MSVVVLPSRITPNASNGDAIPLSIRRIFDSPWTSASNHLGCSVAPVYGDLLAWNFSRGASTPKDEHTERTRSGASASETEKPSSMPRSSGSTENLWTRASCRRFGPVAIGSMVIPMVISEPYSRAVTRRSARAARRRAESSNSRNLVAGGRRDYSAAASSEASSAASWASSATSSSSSIASSTSSM